MKNELSVTSHNEMVQSYEIAIAAKEVSQLRDQARFNSAKAIAELLSRNPNPMQGEVLIALDEASKNYDNFTEIYNGLMESAATLMPTRKTFDDTEAVFSPTPQYSGPPNL